MKKKTYYKGKAWNEGEKRGMMHYDKRSKKKGETSKNKI